MGIVFIYYKEDKIKVLNNETANNEHDQLIKNGWEHKKTIDAAIFLEYLHNECSPTDMVAEIIELSTD